MQTRTGALAVATALILAFGRGSAMPKVDPPAPPATPAPVAPGVR